MRRVAIVEGGIVAQVLVCGEDWADTYPAGVASETANVGDLWDGAAFAPAAAGVGVDLPALKASLMAQVDAAAETERLKYITGGAGQAMTYLAKVEEARRLESDPAPVAAAYPLLSGEVGITAFDLGGVGGVVLASYGAWLQVGAAIEAVRLGAKASIDTAETAAEAMVAAVVSWPEG